MGEFNVPSFGQEYGTRERSRNESVSVSLSAASHRPFLNKIYGITLILNYKKKMFVCATKFFLDLRAAVFLKKSD